MRIQRIFHNLIGNQVDVVRLLTHKQIHGFERLSPNIGDYRYMRRCFFLGHIYETNYLAEYATFHNFGGKISESSPDAQMITPE